MAVLITDQTLSTALPLLFSFKFQRKKTCEANTLNIPILQMRKLRLREAHLPEVPQQRSLALN